MTLFDQATARELLVQHVVGACEVATWEEIGELFGDVLRVLMPSDPVQGDATAEERRGRFLDGTAYRKLDTALRSRVREEVKM